MDRKLNAILMALSASGLFLVVALLAATPVDDGASLAAPDIAPGLVGDAEAGPRDPRSGTARRGLAMPYFSFARGMRRIGG